MKPRDDLPGGVDDADGRPGRLQLCPAAQTDDNPVEDGDPRIIQHADSASRSRIRPPVMSRSHDERCAENNRHPVIVTEPSARHVRRRPQLSVAGGDYFSGAPLSKAPRNFAERSRMSSRTRSAMVGGSCAICHCRSRSTAAGSPGRVFATAVSA